MDIQSILNKNFYESGEFIPSLTIPDKESDKIITWSKNFRLDNISLLYYNTPYYDFIIKIKNAHLGEDQYKWEDGESVIIPYPLNSTLTQLKEVFDIYKAIW